MQSWYKSYWRLIIHPYAFWEEMIALGNPAPAAVFFVISLIITQLGWLCLLINTHGTVYRMGLQFLLGILSYPLSIIFIFLITRLFVREIRLRSFFIVWGFSYLPTLVFFGINIGAHLLQSVPFADTLFNIPIISLGIWALLLLLFLWKLLLLAITLRLAGNLNAGQIIFAIILLLSLTFLYWWLMIYFNLGKVPYL